MNGLAGKTALVTGASSGIGQAIAIRLATEGCNIAINYRKSIEDAEATEKIAMQKACGQVEGARPLIDLVIESCYDLKSKKYWGWHGRSIVEY